MQMEELMEVDERIARANGTVNDRRSCSSNVVVLGTEEPMEIGEEDTLHRDETINMNTCLVERVSPFKKGSLVIVFDTSAVITLPLLMLECVEAANYVIIPYKVIAELDSIKRKDCRETRLRAAEVNSILYDFSRLKNEFVRFESSFQCNEPLEGFECDSNDDFILKCALAYLTKYACSAQVLLATEDKNLSLKAAANHLTTATTMELIDVIERQKQWNGEAGPAENKNGSNISCTAIEKSADTLTRDIEDLTTKVQFSPLPAFDFSWKSATQTSSVLDSLDAAIKSARSVNAPRKLEPELSKQMQEFLDCCDLTVARICTKRSKLATDETAKADSEALMLAIAGMQRYAVGSVSDVLKQVESIAPRYLGKEVLFDKTLIGKEYPSVWRQAYRRLAQLQTRLQ